MTPLLTVADIADTLNVSVKTARKVILSPFFPSGAVIRIGKLLRVRPEKFDVWLQAGGSTDVLARSAPAPVATGMFRKRAYMERGSPKRTNERGAGKPRQARGGKT